MIQTVCDRCGAVITREMREKSMTILTYHLDMEGRPSQDPAGKQDVCPDCSADMGRFMSTPPPKAGRK